MLNPDRSGPGLREFVALMALMTSLVALSIDAMLPALADIGRDLGVTHPNEAQLVVSALLAGLSVAQLFYGPISDSLGRKPVIYAGFALFLAGTVVAILATDFTTMLAGRFLQGVGAAGPKVVTVALVRDRYEGRAMARIMSLIMMVFILVPVLAPAIGQGILLVAEWRTVFGLLLALALVAVVWFALRLPETLPRERRKLLSAATVIRGVRETCTNRVAFGYIVAAGFIFGAFVGYLVTAPQIFQGQYGQGAKFPLYFGGLAAAIGAASYVNARLVMRYGMRSLSRRALWSLSTLSLVFFAVGFVFDGHPPLWALTLYLLLAFFALGILFGNFNALAMEPLGHIAGTGAAVVGALSSLMAMSLGTLLGQANDGTVLPLTAGFLACGLASLLAARWADG